MVIAVILTRKLFMTTYRYYLLAVGYSFSAHG